MGSGLIEIANVLSEHCEQMALAQDDDVTWHIEQQLHAPEQQDSDLLFPSTVGTFRSPTVLNKPFAEVAEDLGLPAFTQRGMRRTYNDLARFAKVDRLVSGHGTEEMEALYNSVAPEEQRDGIAKVISLIGRAALERALVAHYWPPGGFQVAPKRKNRLGQRL